MWMMPMHLHVNQKSDYDDDDERISSTLLQLLHFFIKYINEKKP